MIVLVPSVRSGERCQEPESQQRERVLSRDAMLDPGVDFNVKRPGVTPFRVRGVGQVAFVIAIDANVLLTPEKLTFDTNVFY